MFYCYYYYHYCYWELYLRFSSNLASMSKNRGSSCLKFIPNDIEQIILATWVPMITFGSKGWPSWASISETSKAASSCILPSSLLLPIPKSLKVLSVNRRCSFQLGPLVVVMPILKMLMDALLLFYYRCKSIERAWKQVYFYSLAWILLLHLHYQMLGLHACILFQHKKKMPAELMIRTIERCV